MIKKLPALTIFIVISLLSASCEKKDVPIALPPEGETTIEKVIVGDDYENQVYYNLATQSVVMTSKMTSWDLAFETGATEYHIYLNSGKEMVAYNTHETDITKVTELPKDMASTDWVCDKSCGLPDSAAIGEWKGADGVSKGEVYILKVNEAFSSDPLKKIQIVAVNSESYVIQYSSLKNNDIKQLTIPKEETFNYSYCSFDGEIVHPEPPKETWDIVFRRYHYMYYQPIISPYPVVGALLNPYKTTGFIDTLKKFDEIDHTIISPEKFSNFRDVIGHQWKDYEYLKGIWTIFSNKNYIIKTQRDDYWKIHFIGYLDERGFSGYPNFEFKRIL